MKKKFLLIVLSLLLSQQEMSAITSHEIYDYVIIGAGNAGCVIANRLSEDPNVTVCVLEAGRDDARIPISKQRLPLPSDAPIPQPRDYNWQQYIRGGLQTLGPLYSRGFTDWWFFQKYTPNPNSRSITYDRAATWGGCTSHNQGVCIRQSPFNWDQWVAVGLVEWNADSMIKWYKKVENRSQIAAPQFGGQPYYSSLIPVGTLGNFNPEEDGLNGYVPTLYLNYSQFINPDLTLAMDNAVLNLNSMGFSYRNPFTVPGPYPPGFNLIDAGTQDRNLAAQGGLGGIEWTLVDQNGQISFPGTTTLVPTSVYNQKIYGDNGFVYPIELAPFGQIGLAPYERVSSANTYLYAAQNRDNLTIKSEVLVTRLLLDTKGKNPKAKGVEYLKGWNIYQAGRNPNPLDAGYGGTPGDARANAQKSKERGTRRIYARREVILAAGVLNTPQIMMLSGLGPKHDLEAVGIECVKDIPGVGQNMNDNAEMFITWQTNPLTPTPAAPPAFTLTAKPTPSTPIPTFDITFVLNNGSTQQVLESMDYTIQNGWMGLQSPGGIDDIFVRNHPSALLLDFSSGKTQNGPNGPIGYFPTYFDPAHSMFCLMEKEVFNSTRGYVKLQSKDPTVPPKIVFNANHDTTDIEDMYNVFYNNVLPTMLALHNPDPTKDFFAGLIDPMPTDILKPGLTHFTSMADIDPARLYNFVANKIAGHHACGTCKMGLKSDPLAVVDPHGKVYGVRNLRIADMSILPGAIRWPNLNLYPIGERLAHFIKKENKKPKKEHCHSSSSAIES